ncbi:MAG: hypothetical protein CMK59_01050 [Proteobacteria bacterium]|nr:hypothetical protein [Pseudomonadota bacterium]
MAHKPKGSGIAAIDTKEPSPIPKIKYRPTRGTQMATQRAHLLVNNALVNKEIPTQKPII